MSQAMWCDKGEHAFSAKDPDRQHFTKTATVEVPTGNSYGRATYQQREEITEQLDICGPCWKAGNDFSKRQPERPEIPPEKATIEDLERDDTSYRAGFAAGQESILYREGMPT